MKNIQEFIKYNNVLKETFEQFYGKQYSEKINTLFSNIVFFTKNENDYISSNGDNNYKPIEWFTKEEEKNVIMQIASDDEPIIQVNPKYIDRIGIDSIIHEINHLLIAGRIVSFGSDNGLYINGIPDDNLIISPSMPFLSNDGRSCNPLTELINEYMARDIFEIVSCNYPDLSNYKATHGNIYIRMDAVTDYFIKDIYEMLKHIIKDFLINIEGDKLRTIIGEDEVKRINKDLNAIEDYLDKNEGKGISIDNISFHIEKDKETDSKLNHAIEDLNNLKETVNNNCSNYLYMKNMEEKFGLGIKRGR